MTQKEFFDQAIQLQETANFLLYAIAFGVGILWGAFTWFLTLRAKDEKDFF
jgi:hypothetical protein